MSDIKIWHNPRCKKSREGLQYLKDKGIKPEIYDYAKHGIKPDELIQIIQQHTLCIFNYMSVFLRFK